MGVHLLNAEFIMLNAELPLRETSSVSPRLTAPSKELGE